MNSKNRLYAALLLIATSCFANQNHSLVEAAPCGVEESAFRARQEGKFFRLKRKLFRYRYIFQSPSHSALEAYTSLAQKCIRGDGNRDGYRYANLGSCTGSQAEWEWTTNSEGAKILRNRATSFCLGDLGQGKVLGGGCGMPDYIASDLGAHRQTCEFHLIGPEFCTTPPSTFSDVYAEQCACGYTAGPQVTQRKTETSGFVLSQILMTSLTCVDVNECENGQITCPQHSSCENRRGSYTCMCNEGFRARGNGATGGDDKLECEAVLDGANFDINSIGSTKATLSGPGINRIEGVSYVTVTVKEETSPTIRNVLFDYDEAEYTVDQIVNGIDLSQGLTAGTKYLVYTAVWDQNRVLIPSTGGVLEFETTCGCSGGQTDEPRDLQVFQEDGYITFEWMDNSMCEEGYAFNRRIITSDDELTPFEVFAPNYFYYSNHACREEPYRPGRQITDNLRTNGLQVGTNVEYCAVPIATSYRGSQKCTTHKVFWEATLEGVVTLPRNTGGLPVDSVRIHYALHRLDGTIAFEEVTTTGKSGQFSISVASSDNTFSNDDRFKLSMVFQKNSTVGTGNLEHTFLCHNEEVECSESAAVVYLKHLEKAPLFEVVDDTSIPFKGKVVVASTGNGFGFMGCPVQGVKVCLVDHKARSSSNTGICTETKANGEYELAAIIGTKVSIYLEYKDHTFSAIEPNKELELAGGVHISESGVYENFDFEDTTRTNLHIEIAGGKCNINLGISEINVKIPSCANWEGETFSQEEFHGVHSVVAHDLEVSVQSIVTKTGESRNFEEFLSPRRIDMSNTAENTTAAPSQFDNVESANGLRESSLLKNVTTETEEKTDVSMLRFQFDGTTRLKSVLRNDKKESCDGLSTGSGFPPGFEFTQFHVYPAKRLMHMKIFVEQFFAEDLPVCTTLPDDYTVTVTNGLGLLSAKESQTDREYKQQLINNGYPDEFLKLLEFCNEGCNTKLDHDIDPLTGKPINARVNLLLMAGRPNTAGDLTKRLTVSTNWGIRTRFYAKVLLTGDFDGLELDTFTIPTHKPLLVIRDPPGGLSYAYYDNIQTTIKAKHNVYEAFVGFKGMHEIGTDIDLALDMCTGLAVLVCNNLLELGMSLAGDVNGGISVETEHRDDKHTAAYVTSFSYKTSTDVWMAGKQSDSFLVPTLRIKFYEVTEISFDVQQCSADSNTKPKFNLEDTGNQPALTWLTYFQLTKEKLPKLQQNLESLIEDENDPNKSQQELETIAKNKAATEDAIKGWNETLSNYEVVNEMALNDPQNLIKPHQWFDKYAKKRTEFLMEEYGTTLHESSDRHRTSLIPEGLKLDSRELNLPGTINERTTDEAVQAANLINFVGGGNLFEFKLQQSMVHEKIKKFGTPKQNSRGSIGFDLTMEHQIGPFTLGREYDRFQEIEQHNQKLDGSQLETSVGFVLGDEDSGDEFNVHVFLDPYYGTFVFRNDGGQSRCPHEAGTSPRESPEIDAHQGKEFVMPDEEIIIHVDLVNMGSSPSAFQVFTDHRDNNGLLSHLMNGDTLTVPQQYDRIEPMESLSSTVTISRGPRMYNYPAMKLFLRSACEFTRNIGDGNLIALDQPTSVFTLLWNREINGEKRIVFSRPCPRVELSIPDLVAGRVVKNRLSSKPDTMYLRIRNPEASASSLAKIANEEFEDFERIELLHRTASSNDWVITRFTNEEGLIVDFDFLSFKEDAFGFITAPLDISGYQNGEYLFQVRSVCSSREGSLPDSFAEFNTPSFSLLIDRTPPMLWGLPKPSFKPLYPGNAVSFEFTENIQCAEPFKFLVEAEIDGYHQSFDNRNNLLLRCKENTVSVQFDFSLETVTDVFGRNVVFKLSGVSDLSGNLISNPIIHKLQFQTFDVHTGLVEFSLKIDMPCNDTVLSKDISKELSDVLSVPENRFEVSRVECLNGNDVRAFVTILSEDEGSPSSLRRTLSHDSSLNINPTRRSLQQENNLTDALSLFEGLYKAISQGTVSGYILSKVQPNGGLNDFAVSQLDVASSDADSSEPVVYIPNPRQQELLETLELQMSALDVKIEEKKTGENTTMVLEVIIGAASVLIFLQGVILFVFLRKRKPSSENFPRTAHFLSNSIKENCGNQRSSSESRNPTFQEPDV